MPEKSFVLIINEKLTGRLVATTYGNSKARSRASAMAVRERHLRSQEVCYSRNIASGDCRCAQQHLGTWPLRRTLKSSSCNQVRARRLSISQGVCRWTRHSTGTSVHIVCDGAAQLVSLASLPQERTHAVEADAAVMPALLILFDRRDV